MSDLVELARRYVAASDVLESLRNEIRRAVLNGGGEKPEAPFTQPARSSGGTVRSRAQAHHPNAVKSQKIDQQVIDLLRATPGMKVGELAKATNAKTSTTGERLRRMRERGSVAPVDGGGWQAVAASP
jgi:hypothetical protein